MIKPCDISAIWASIRVAAPATPWRSFDPIQDATARQASVRDRADVVVWLAYLRMRAQRLHPADAPALPLEVVILDTGRTAACVVVVVGGIGGGGQGAAEGGEESAEHVVIGPLLVAQAQGIGNELLQGPGMALAQFLGGQSRLDVADLPEHGILRLASNARPREISLEAVQPSVASCHQVIPATLREVAHSVHGSVPHGAPEFGCTPHWHMPLIPVVPLSQTEVNKYEMVPLLGDAAHKVAWLYVTVNDAHGVQQLDAIQHLLGNQHRCLEREAAVACMQSLFQALT
eukprot:CAMPEP_0115469158 /NCGR_PEP_ID=MMETSP0271-20121206/51332_1 /TAXON_ID=71861 /ORGANISM="Scrippsiella trochoidea, Strain CCMP3099" /LENGTH=287 /DNA_ID=CAMNT_0002896241 /DNA_START=185 /DNA_END=1048 /DNA_ORIENTATION=+